MNSLNKQEIHPIDCIATGYLQTMCFDMNFNYIRGSIEQVNIFPEAPDKWESESCKLIPHVRYEYTRVSKTNPETSRSALANTNQARKKVKLFAKAAKNEGSVLRVIKETIVTKLQPNVNAIRDVTLYYLEESYGSLSSDPIASERKTREIPPDLKQTAKAASKKKTSKPNLHA